MRDPLNRSTAPQIVRFFDVCFKQGVYDAYGLTDDFSAREFVNKHKDSFTFGILGDEVEYDWQMFRFTLYRWARMNHMKNLAENYILFIRRPSHLWALLPYCMQFYLLGIEEWLDYPVPSRIQLFKTNPKSHWDQNLPIKKFTLPDYVSYLHEFAYAYRRTPEDTQIVPSSIMDGFCMALYDLTRRYVAKTSESDI